MRQHAQPVLPALGPAGAVIQDQVSHGPDSIRQSRIRHAACGSAFRRGWEGEGKPQSMPWRGPAGEARHPGVMIGVWEREGKALEIGRASWRERVGQYG